MSAERAAVDAEPGFAALVRQNRNFRYLWLGQVVSQLGDWFNSVAVYALLLDLTHSATAVAIMMVVQLLPSAVIGPFAGVLVDRFDRRRVMIAADLLRGVLIVGLLLATSVDRVWLIYLVIGLAVVATSFFEPARAAMLPAVVSRRELLTANALSAATWATMLAVGAALGGVVTAVLGRNAAFLVNSASFFASALFIWRIVSPPSEPVAAEGSALAPGLVNGLRYLRANPAVVALVSVKGVWAIAGGILLLLTVFGERVFRTAGSTAAGIGILYAARGVGAGAGALIARAAFGNDPDRLRRGLGPAYLLVGLSYGGLAAAPDIWTASAAVVVAHLAGSMLWVGSNVLLQLNVPDRMRGRVFAIDFALLTLVSAAASYATAFALDTFGVGPRTMAAVIGALFLAPGTAWLRTTRLGGL